MCVTPTDLEELVFAVPTVELWKLLTYKEKGLITGKEHDLARIVKSGMFLDRNDLESDPSFKQIIPYAILTSDESYYLFRRITGQNEKRLHNKLHLGVGGHMNPGKDDDPPDQYIVNELKRELFEEVNLSGQCTISSIDFLGFINDDTIPVGNFHLGLLYIIRLSNRDITINETDKMTGRWIDKDHLTTYFKEMESWSIIATETCIHKI